VAQLAAAEIEASSKKMQDSFDMTTIIFALLAAFVVWKLRSILGTRNGEEKPPSNPFANRGTRARAGDAEGKVITLPGAAAPNAARAAFVDQAERWKGFAEPGSKTWTGLDAIAAADPSFAIQPFIDGAKAAYEMIVTAFAAGNREVLENLLAKDVYDSFATALAEREKRGEKVETTFVSIDKALVDDAAMRNGSAQITLRFSVELITATRDESGSVIDGSPERVSEINDVWTFARDVGSRDPNWKIIATGPGQ
jgi:predicted lipid-binding transport protein (Tim44 family)